ncbi:hypothetical protein WOLCODRAFT_145139 [Wolfiporia cocos MD-104 SS10]|uniref:Uncharacterized protein n=1 Tax=Wolfiporia cocos (strain MD-104) TaxID=742152 RepID=A0A2H3K0P3_WOLCO|nr:hypothetical protein WOLCODRAFT_145139 [Wolfiporia cocos MD-104 SS10]
MPLFRETSTSPRLLRLSIGCQIDEQKTQAAWAERISLLEIAATIHAKYHQLERDLRHYDRIAASAHFVTSEKSLLLTKTKSEYECKGKAIKRLMHKLANATFWPLIDAGPRSAVAEADEELAAQFRTLQYEPALDSGWIKQARKSRSSCDIGDLVTQHTRAHKENIALQAENAALRRHVQQCDTEHAAQLDAMRREIQTLTGVVAMHNVDDVICTARPLLLRALQSDMTPLFEGIQHTIQDMLDAQGRRVAVTPRADVMSSIFEAMRSRTAFSKPDEGNKQNAPGVRR